MIPPTPPIRLAVVFRLSSIGDVLIAAQSIHTLWRQGYYTVLVTSTDCQPIARTMPYLNICIAVDKQGQLHYFKGAEELSEELFLKAIASLKTKYPPVGIDLQRTPRSKRALKSIKKLIAFEEIYKVQKSTCFRLFLILKARLAHSQKPRTKQSQDPPKTIANSHHQLLQILFAKDGQTALPMHEGPFLHKIPTGPRATPVPVPGAYVCLFPGASFFTKAWPKEHFRELMDFILEKTTWHIVLCGSPQESNLGLYLDFPKNSRVLNTIGQTTLEQTLNLICDADHIVTNDSFPTHAAKGFAKRATVLFGPTTPAFGFAPVCTHIQIVYANLSCSPCSRHGNSPCRYGNLLCLQSISADSVFKIVNHP